MDGHVKAAVAAIAISHASGRKVSAIHGDPSLVIEVSMSGDRVSGYDYTNSCHIDGTMPNLFHYGNGSHLEMKVRGNGRYDGFDYGAGCHFEVTVRGRSADVFDYGGSGYTSYSA